MVLHPEVQRKAQQEIHRVVGTDRLPSFDDREHLSYLAAVHKEVLRWHTVGPLGIWTRPFPIFLSTLLIQASPGIPHCTTADDMYDGYFIPKGSLVISNIWYD